MDQSHNNESEWRAGIVCTNMMPVITQYTHENYVFTRTSMAPVITTSSEYRYEPQHEHEN